MKLLWKCLLTLSASVCGTLAHADITFFERENFEGRAFTAERTVPNFVNLGFNDKASSIMVTGEPWEVCEHVDFQGRCTILRPGRYPSLRGLDMNNLLSSARPAGREHPPVEVRPPHEMKGQITFFEHDGFQGRAFVAEGEVPNFVRYGFNDRASSVMVLGERWEACEHVDFGGRCVILRPGRYPSLSAMGLNDQVSSVRPVRRDARFDDHRYAPHPVPVYDWRRRPEERIYQVPVISARAVFAAPQQRCWVEREQVQQPARGEPNVGGAVIGGVIGGILGHQVGSGSNRDVATVSGAVVGAVVGSQVGRDAAVVTTRDVQRCASVPAQGRPEFWDVVYQFRGVEHHVQMTAPPGPTVQVNENGEPRL